MTVPRILPPKVTRPVLCGSLPRERLYRQLDESRDRPVIWVAGPPGCGKTTLVSGYVDARCTPCVWYSVDERDADLATFFHFLGLATQRARSKDRDARPAAAPPGPPCTPALARRHFVDIVKRIRPPSILVFDDWQNAPPRSPLDETVRHGIAALPKGVRIAFISRDEVPPDFVREVDRRRMEHLGWKDLRLTFEETREIARLQRKDPSEDLVRYLQGRTGGWATGVTLLLDHAQMNGIEPQRIGRETPEEIVEYLGGTLFERADAETRAFLVKSAFLPRMTAKSAEALTGHAEAGKLLHRLNRNNYFTELHPGDEAIFEYHSLFRDFLNHRAGELLSAEEARAITRKAAALLEETGQTDDAVELMRRSGDFEGLTRVIRAEAPSLVGQGRSATLGGWIATLPGDVRAGDPWLLYWDGMCAAAREPRAGIDAFDQAFDLFLAAGDEAGSFLAWSGAVDATLCELNDLTILDNRINWLERRATERASFPSAGIEARVSAGMAGALLWRRPDRRVVGSWVERALSAAGTAGDDGLRLRALLESSALHHWSGDRAAASRAAEEIQSMTASQGDFPVWAIARKWVESSFALWAEADPGAALAAVSEGLEISGRTGVHIWDPMLFAFGAYASLLEGDGTKTSGFLGKMAVEIRGRRVMISLYEHLCGWHHVLRGDAISATAHAERALSEAEAAGAVFPAILCRIALASIASGRRDHAAAAAQLSRAIPLARASGSRILEFAAHLEEARVALDLGHEAAGLAALRNAFSIGRREGYVNLFWWWEPTVMTRLCLAALHAGIETDYVVTLVRRRNLCPQIPPMEIEEWPWKIRVHTLGRFGVVREGRKVESAGKSQRKPLQLLKVLIALGGRDIPREKVSDLLWPEADGDRALQSLAVTVRRLRQLLGDEKSVLLTDGRLTLSNRVCWVDCWAFKRIFARSGKALREDAGGASGEDAAALLEKALGLYRGEFLEDEKEAPWAVAMRERLRIKFLRCVMDAARIRETVGDWEKALACYRKGLAADDLHEEFHRGIMICHHRLGRSSEALAAYQCCRRTLQAALGVDPSPETEAVLASVRKGHGESPGSTC